MEWIVGAAIAGVLLAIALFKLIWIVVGSAVGNLFDWAVYTFGNEGAVRNLTGEPMGDESSGDRPGTKPADLTSRALQIAVEAHAGQPDKGGRSYIGHVLRVAGGAAVVADPDSADDALIVGLLHDVVEDTGVTLDDLHKEFPVHIVDAVDAMTRRKPPKHETTEDDASYLDRIKANRLARFVKVADSLDNSDERRLRIVADKDLQAHLRTKYSHYLEILEHLPEDH